MISCQRWLDEVLGSIPWSSISDMNNIVQDWISARLAVVYNTYLIVDLRVIIFWDYVLYYTMICYIMIIFG